VVFDAVVEVFSGFAEHELLVRFRHHWLLWVLFAADLHTGVGQQGRRWWRRRQAGRHM